MTVGNWCWHGDGHSICRRCVVLASVTVTLTFEGTRAGNACSKPKLAINVRCCRASKQVKVPPTFLCTANFPANTGFAWDFIERLYARMADRLQHEGVRTLVAYPVMESAPRSLEGSAAVPIVLDTRLQTWRHRVSMAQFIRRENVQVVYFTDRPLWSVWYPFLRLAGARKIIVHDHTSGERTVPSGIHRAIKQAAIKVPGVFANVIVAVSNYVAERDRAVALLRRFDGSGTGSTLSRQTLSETLPTYARSCS